jgi:hypothetical protein
MSECRWCPATFDTKKYVYRHESNSHRTEFDWAKLPQSQMPFSFVLCAICALYIATKPGAEQAHERALVHGENVRCMPCLSPIDVEAQSASTPVTTDGGAEEEGYAGDGSSVAASPSSF